MGWFWVGGRGKDYGIGNVLIYGWICVVGGWGGFPGFFFLHFLSYLFIPPLLYFPLPYLFLFRFRF